MKSKKYVYCIFCVFAILILLFFSVSDENKSVLQANEKQNASSNEFAEVNEKVASLGAQVAGSSNKVNSWFPMGDAATAEKIKAWFAARGNYSFYGPDAYNEYQNYDMETLTKLSDSGDFRAMHVLADRTEYLSERKKILYKAAVYGSTEALARIATIQDIDRNDDFKSYEDKKAVLFEILAYQEVAEIRGDWWPNIQMKDYYLKKYQIDLTEQDYESITNIAKKVFEDMQEQRRGLGLGDFDNSTPAEVIKFYEEMVKPL